MEQHCRNILHGSPFPLNKLRNDNAPTFVYQILYVVTTPREVADVARDEINFNVISW